MEKIEYYNKDETLGALSSRHLPMTLMTTIYQSFNDSLLLVTLADTLLGKLFLFIHEIIWLPKR